VDQDSSEDKWYTGFVLAVTVSSHPMNNLSLPLTEQDYKVYLLTIALTACIVGLSFNM
jgi:hypothetical protein